MTKLTFKEFFSDIITEKESDAAKSAKTQGLTSGGWGTWKNSSGKTVAKTINGKLVYLSGDDSTNDFGAYSKDTFWKYEKPSTERDDSKWYAASSEELNNKFRDVNFYSWEPKNGSHYFLAAFKRFKNKVEALQNNGTYPHDDIREISVTSFCKEIFDILNVSPKVVLNLDDEKCDEIHEMTGTTTLGLYQNSNSVQLIRLSRTITDNLMKLTSTDESEWRKFFGHNRTSSIKADRLHELHEIYGAVRVAIHESVHAKDRYLSDLANLSRDLEVRKDEAFILEGLTELRARELTYKLFNKKARNARDRHLYF